MKLEQIFDAKLKRKGAPKWMVKGIPRRTEGKDQVKNVIQP